MALDSGDAVDSGDSKVHGVRLRIAVADPETEAMCEGLHGDTSWSGGIVSLAWAQTFVARSPIHRVALTTTHLIGYCAGGNSIGRHTRKG